MRFIRGGSWAGYSVFLSSVFLWVFMFSFFVFLYVLFSLFLPSLFKLLHLQSNKHVYKQKNKLEEKHKQNNINNRSLPAGTWDIYSRSGRGLDILYFCLLFNLFFFRFLCFVFVSLCFFFLFLFSPSLFKLLHLQSKKHI